VIFTVIGSLNYLGTFAPWSPKMDAWTSTSLPVNYLEGRAPLERQGAVVFHSKQCINCHSIGGAGGLRGPALDSVATRLTSDQLVRQVIQGSGNMPAYGKNLTPAEVAALVSFMRTLHNPTEVPARDATQPEQRAEQIQQSVPAHIALAKK
jgi:ubiquinol-cytochrome c reductase cytochrome b subunit